MNSPYLFDVHDPPIWLFAYFFPFSHRELLSLIGPVSVMKEFNCSELCLLSGFPRDSRMSRTSAHYSPPFGRDGLAVIGELEALLHKLLNFSIRESPDVMPVRNGDRRSSMDMGQRGCAILWTSSHARNS